MNAALSLVTGCLVAACLVTACSAEGPGEQPSDGPLLLGGDDGSICVPASTSGEYTYGLESVSNTTDGPVEVLRAELVGPGNVTLEGSFLAPVDDQTLIGVRPGWPPDGAEDGAFARKRELPTTVQAGEEANLVLHLTARVPADVQRVALVYRVDAEDHRAVGSTSLAVRNRCS